MNTHKTWNEVVIQQRGEQLFEKAKDQQPGQVSSAVDAGAMGRIHRGKL